MTDEFTNEFLEWARTHPTDVSAIGLNILIDHIDESHAKIAQLTAERDELYNWIIDILELARTGLPPSFMTEEQWASHRLNRIAHIASQAKQETK